MTISSTVRVAGPYSGNDVTVTFSFAFKVFAAADVQVILTDSTDTESVLTLTTDYTVTLNGNQDTNPGGSVTLLVAPATGEKLTVTSDQASYQSVNLANQGGFYPEVINNQLDKLAINIQQCERDIAQAARVPLSSDIDPDIVSDALITVATSIGDVEIVAGSVGDVGTVATNIANVNLVGGDITNVNSVAGDLANIDAVAGDLTNIDVVAADIASVNTCANNIVAIQSAPAYAAAAAASADESEAYANLALTANDAAEAAASASGSVLFYDTKASANSALSGLSDGQIVEVMSDESVSGLRTRYRKTSGAYVFKIIVGDPLLTTKAALQAVPYSSMLTTAQTLGFYAAGDGGGGLWRWDATAASTVYANGGTVVRPTGHSGSGVWRRVYDGPVNVLWFGAYRDNTNSTTTRAAIQAAIDWAIYRDTSTASAITGYEDVYIPGGRYSVDDVIQLGYGDGFHSCNLRGAGVRFLGETIFTGTAIIPTFSDRPAIAVNGARHSKISNLSIVGLNRSWVVTQRLGDVLGPLPYTGKSFSRTGTTVTVTHTSHPFGEAGKTLAVNVSGASSTFKDYQYTITIVDANTYTFTTTESGDATGTCTVSVNDRSASAWIDPALNANANSRYAPYAAIAIDAYKVATPSPAYPTRPFPSWIGYSTQYSTGVAASSYVVIEDVGLNGFAVGVVSQPGGGDGNGDFLKVSRTQITECVYGVSIGHTQARGTALDNCVLSQVHTAFTTGTHGLQNGKPHCIAKGCEFSFGMTIANIQNISYGGCIVFEGCYGETVYQVGTFTSGGAQRCPVSFIGCEFSFDSWDVRGVPLNVANTNSVVNFQECKFTSNRSDVYLLPFTGTGFRFNNCRVSMYDDNNSAAVSSSARRHAINSTLKIGATGKIGTLGVSTGIYNLTSGTFGGSPVTAYTSSNAASRPRYLCQYMHNTTLPTPFAHIVLPTGVFDKAGATITQSGRTVTIALASPSPEYVYIRDGGDVGDYCYDSVTSTTFIVISRTTNTLTLEAQNNYNHSGNLFSTIAASGTLYAFNCRMFGLGYYTTYNSTASSATITASTPDGTISWLPSTERGVAANDYLFTKSDRLYLTDDTGGKINSVSGTTGAIVLNSNMLATKTGADFCLFVKKLANE